MQNWFSMMTALLPLAYGYLRDDLVHGRDRDSGDDLLRAAARSLGYELATVFHEPSPQSGLLPPAFVDLIQECRRAAAHTVLTLPGHMSNMSMSRMVLHEVLHTRAEAIVHEIECCGSAAGRPIPWPTRTIRAGCRARPTAQE
jgi:hypothetical protein